MSRILSMLRGLDQQEEENPELPSKFEKVKDDLVGLRRRVQEPEPPALFNKATHTKEPGDFEFEETDRYDQNSLRRGEQYMNAIQQNRQMSPIFERDAGIQVNDTYLYSLAKMAIASLNLKSNLMMHPIRMAAGWAYKFADKPEIAEKISQIKIDDDLEEIKELLIEVQFQKLKALQRADNLRIPEVSELLEHRKWAFAEKIAGEGFENLTELADGLYQKFTKKKP